MSHNNTAAQGDAAVNNAPAPASLYSADDALAESGELSGMTVTQLKALARQLGLSNYSAYNKDELIAAIEAAQAEI